MKTLLKIPARFVGEFERENAWNPSCVPNFGDVAIVHGYPDGYDRVYIRCACGEVDAIRLAGPEPTWSITSRDPVHLTPSVRVSAGAADRMCHYVILAGELSMLGDSTRRLARAFTES